MLKGLRQKSEAETLERWIGSWSFCLKKSVQIMSKNTSFNREKCTLLAVIETMCKRTLTLYSVKASYYGNKHHTKLYLQYLLMSPEK